MTKLVSAKFKKKCFVQDISYWEFKKKQRLNSADPGDWAHSEQPHLD